jgi:hypothetical protein
VSRESPVKLSDNWFVGEDQTFRFVVRQGPNDSDPVQNITGWTLRWELRADPGSADAILVKTSGAGIVITDAVNGVCEVTINRTDTQALSPDTYFYTLARTTAGAFSVLAHGSATLRLGATR